LSTDRQLAGRAGALESWAATRDRTARTANGRKAGPGDLDWHLARLDPVRFADATPAQKLAAADAAKRAWYARLALSSAQARRAKAAKRAAKN
jgi:hypothetical protein